MIANESVNLFLIEKSDKDVYDALFLKLDKDICNARITDLVFDEQGSVCISFSHIQMLAEFLEKNWRNSEYMDIVFQMMLSNKKFKIDDKEDDQLRKITTKSPTIRYVLNTLCVYFRDFISEQDEIRNNNSTLRFAWLMAWSYSFSHSHNELIKHLKESNF